MLSESLKGVVAQVLLKKIGGGRVAAREIMLTAGSVANLIREGKTFQLPSIIQTNKKAGMILLNDSLIELVEKKIVDPLDAYMKAVDKSGMEAMLKARNIKIEVKE
jgi:twitching motility protein PilT